MSEAAPESVPAGVPPERIPGLYAWFAPFYDVWAKLEANARQRCLELAALRDGEAVLEVAVGTGLLFEKVLRANPSGRNVGVDVTLPMLERAQRRAGKTGVPHTLALGDARKLDFEDASFDLVVSNYLFDLMPEKDFTPVLREFFRVLRPGGRLVIANLARAEGAAERAYQWMYRLTPSLLGGCRGVTLPSYVEAAGFRAVQREQVSQLGFRSELVRAER
jgi:ubiquinone/menaquinone biosynthesis C-methylase UbiE